MSIRRARLRAPLWLPCTLCMLAGCAGTEYRLTPALGQSPAIQAIAKGSAMQGVALPSPAVQSIATQGPTMQDISMQADDIDNALGEPAITERTVGRDLMLRRRAQVELKVGASVPVGLFEDNEFEPGIFLGAKASVEGAKNIFFGISFDYSRNTVDEGVSALANDPSSLPGVTPDQLYESINRYNTLILFDHDIVLVEDTIAENRPLILRWGAGVGVSVIDGKEDPNVGFEIKPFVGFLFRPALGLRWQIHDRGLIFAETSIDFIFPNEIRADPAGPDDSATIDGDIDFSAVNIAVGYAFEF
jgi:hypothetical protein